MIPAPGVFGQSTNALLPSGLYVNSLIPIDTGFMKTYNHSYPQSMKLFQQLFYEITPNGKTKLNHLIVKGMTDTKLPVYDVMEFPVDDHIPPLMPAGEMLGNLGYAVDTVFVEKNGVLEKKLMPNEINEDEIDAVYFTEKWSFDAVAYKMKKEVVGITPVRKTFFNDLGTGEKVFKGFKKVGMLMPKAGAKDVFEPLLKIKYEFILGNEDMLAMETDTAAGCFHQIMSFSGFQIEKTNSPFFNSYSRNKLIDFLIDPVLKGKTDAFDFETGKKMSIAEVKTNLECTRDTVVVFNERTNNYDSLIVVEKFPRKEMIKSVVFEEEWFINPTTMAMRKDVISIAPVLWGNLASNPDYYESGNTTYNKEWRKKIAYVVKMKK